MASATSTMNWRVTAYECYRLAQDGDNDAARAKWRSLNDEIGQAISTADSRNLPGLLDDLNQLVSDVGSWNGNGNGERWVFGFHHALLR